MSDTAVLVAVFDALRRDHVTPDRMPRLAAFTANGSAVPRSRSVFPSATRVNASAFSTGGPPVQHGVVANKFFDPAAFPDRLIDTSSRSEVEEAMKATGMPFLTARSLGEEIGASGRRMGVWSSASRGTTYLTHPHAESLGHQRLCLHDVTAETAEGRAVLERYGPLPPAGRPNTARMTYLARMLADTIERCAEPDVSLIWFNDPDMTYHYKGIGSADARDAVLGVDQAFGMLLDAIAGRPDRERFQIIAMSDHGQIVARERIDVKARFVAGGLRYGQRFGEDVAVVGNLSSISALRVRDTQALYDVCAFLLDQEWVGAVFTAGLGGTAGVVPGTFNKDLLMIGHSRAPDIYFVMASDGEVTHGVPGGGPYLSDVPEGGGMHGGLNLREINNVLALSGSRIRRGFASSLPGGVIDVAPTVLSLLGLERPRTMIGRVLAETMADGEEGAHDEVETVAEVAYNGRKSRLVRHSVGRATYIGGLETA
jgi:hypothetical protein